MDAEERVQAANRLNQITSSLINFYAQHTTLLSDEVRMKVTTFESAFQQMGTVAAAERAADAAAINITVNKIKKMGEIKQLEEERDNIRFHIKHDLG